MGTNVHRSTLDFFQAKMLTHSRVRRCEQLRVPDDFVFVVERTDNLSTVRVHLADAYSYGLPDYAGRPKQIRKGDFILIARPEATFDESLIERARKDGIGIGKLAKFMGALNVSNMETYKSPEERRALGLT
jgi:hypothetical protein